MGNRVRVCLFAWYCFFLRVRVYPPINNWIGHEISWHGGRSSSRRPIISTKIVLLSTLFFQSTAQKLSIYMTCFLGIFDASSNTPPSTTPHFHILWWLNPERTRYSYTTVLMAFISSFVVRKCFLPKYCKNFKNDNVPSCWFATEP